MPTRRRAALLLAASALALALVEGTARRQARALSEYPRGAARRAVDDPAGLIVPSPDPALGYELYRGMDIAFKGRRFQTNSHGFRGDERPLAKSARTFRIVGIGDSVMMGWRIDQDRTYLSLLEAKLNARSGGKRVESLNFGVNGYNTVQEYLTLRDKALAFAPDLVIWNFVGNDLERQQNRRGRLWLETPSYALGFLVLRAQALLGGTEPGLTYDWRPRPRPDADEPDDFWSAFEAVARMGRTRGIPVLLVLDSRYSNPQAPHGRVAARAKELGVACLDLFRLYRRLPESTPISDAVAIDDEHNRRYLFERGIGKDNHPNESWHERTAEVLAARIVAGGYLDRTAP